MTDPQTAHDLTAAPPDGLRLTSSLLENYVTARPVRSTGRVQAVGGSAGDVELVGLGTADRLGYGVRDTTTAGGWSLVRLGTAQDFSADALPDGRTMVVALTAPTTMQYCAFQGRPPENGLRDMDQAWARQSEVVHAFSVRMFASGDAVLMAATQSGGFQRRFYDASTDTWDGWGGTTTEATGIKDSAVLSTRDAQGTVLFFALDESGKAWQCRAWGASPDDIGGWTYLSTQVQGSNARLHLDQLAVSELSGDTVVLVGYSAHDGALYTLRNRGGNWDVAWTRLAGAAVAPRQMLASLDARGALQLFLLAPGGEVSVIHQVKPGGVATTVPVPIATSGAQLTGATGADGNPVGFVVTVEHELVQAIQQADTTDWMVVPVAIDTPDEVVEVRTYTTQLQLYDTRGRPLAGAEVRLWADGDTSVQINGKGTLLSTANASSCRTSQAGTLDLVTVVDGLEAPTLRIWHPGLGSDADVVEMQLNARLQTRLEFTRASDLLDATDASGAPLLSGAAHDPEVADALARSINQCMSIARPPLGRDGPGVERRRRVARADPWVLNRIDPGRVAPQCWSLTTVDGGVVYEDLSADAFDAKRSAAQRRRISLSWGDLKRLVKAGIAKVQEVVVQAVENAAGTLVSAIRGVITAVVAGAEAFWDGVLEYTQQAFDMVEVVFAQVAATFQKIYEWLATLFDWDQILRTQQALLWALDQTMRFMASTLDDVRDGVVDALDGLRAEADAWLASVQTGPYGQTTLMDILDGSGADPQLDRDGPEALGMAQNIVMHGFLANGRGTVVPDTPSPLTESETEELDELGPLTMEDKDKVEGAEDGQDLYAFLKGFVDQPATLLTTPLSKFIDPLQTLIDAGFAALKQAVTMVLDAIRDLFLDLLDTLQAPWDIPWVSALYKRLTGGRSGALSPLGLIALIGAVPTVMVPRALGSDGPLPDQAALDAFKSTYTVANLRQWTELDPRPARSTEEDKDAWPAWAPWTIGVRGFLTLVKSAVDVFSDFDMIKLVVTPPEYEFIPEPGQDATQPSKALGFASFALNVAVRILKAPWLSRPRSQWTFNPQKGAGRANLVWAGVFLVTTGVGANTLRKELRQPKSVYAVGPWAVCGFGVINLVAQLAQAGMRGFDKQPLLTIAGCLSTVPAIVKPVGTPAGAAVVTTAGQELILGGVDLLFGSVSGAMVLTQAYDVA